MLTPQQHKLLEFIQSRLEDTGISPSFDEMKDALGLRSKSGIHRLITALEERGFIRRLANRARALEIVRLPGSDTGPSNVHSLPATKDSRDHQWVDIPMHGRIAAGTPIEALENVDSFVSVPAALVNKAECYALEISGDSMVDKGILDGDTVVIERCHSAHDGDVVVALVDREEATLKTLQRKGQHVALIPANRDHETQIYNADQVQVQGRLVSLMRHYH